MTVFLNMKEKKRISLVLLLISIFGISSIINSCNTDTKKAPDVSKIDVVFNTVRFDTDLYAIDTNNIAEGLRKMAVKYPYFLNYYLDTVMAYNIFNNFNDTTYGIRVGLHSFLTYKDFVELEDTIKKYYPDTKQTDDILRQGFRYMIYYGINKNVPKIIYLNMGLSNWPTFPVDTNTLCIGLDMFLGPQFPPYKSINVPSYMGYHLKKDYIPVSLFSTLYKTIHPFKTDERTLLDMMIQRGKEQYFLHKILPDLPDSVLFGFKGIQLEWCKLNESNIYNFFIQRNLLYNKETPDRISYINDGPFAQGIESGSDAERVTPGNIGTWLGYKIVSSYMAKNVTIELKDLLRNNTEPSRFLDSAKYRPK